MSNNIKLTEYEMAVAFKKMLGKSKENSIFPQFRSIHLEVPNVQGRADILALNKNLYHSKALVKLKTVLEIKKVNAFKILALIKTNSPRTEQYILNRSGLSLNTLKMALNQLLEYNIITQNQNNSYLLMDDLLNLDIDLWAFELKLNNWKRALFQALQFKTYASNVVTVFPMERESILRRNLDVFKRMGIGVIAFDSRSLKIHVLKRPLKIKPKSQAHHLFAISQIVARELKDN